MSPEPTTGVSKRPVYSLSPIAPLPGPSIRVSSVALHAGQFQAWLTREGRAGGPVPPLQPRVGASDIVSVATGLGHSAQRFTSGRRSSRIEEADTSADHRTRIRF